MRRGQLPLPLKMQTRSVCPVCSEEAVDQPSELVCCLRCWTLYSDNRRILTRYDGGCYNFTDEGWFSYLGKIAHVGDELPPFTSYAKRIQPLLDKLWGHFIWVLFWGGVSTGWWLFPLMTDYPLFRTPVMVALLCMVAFHSFLFISYWSAVMMQGLLKPALRPPCWERITRLIQKGALIDAEDAMRQANLMEHPGFLLNLFLGYRRVGEPETGRVFLDRAMSRLEGHPLLNQLFSDVLLESEENRKLGREGASALL
jgi:hypothetical protein